MKFSTSLQDWQIKFFTIFTGILLSCLILYPLGAFIDDYSYDLFFDLRGEESAKHNIVIVAVDESSFEEINMQWPWPRSLHAKLTDALFAAGVKTVAYDILFSEPSEDDASFGASIAANKNVVLVNDINVLIDPHYGYEQIKLVEPNNLISHSKNSALLGFANMRTEPDGFIRRLNVEYEDINPFSLVAARNYADLMRLSLKEIPQKQYEEGRWINFLGGPRTIKTISYYQALDPDLYLPENYLKDALVFIGFATASESTSGMGVIDHYPAPFTRWGGGYFPGVEIHAQAAAGFLESDFIERLDFDTVFLAGIALSVLTGLIVVYLQVMSGTIFLVVFISLCLGVMFFAFTENRLYVSPVMLLFPLCCIYILNPFFQYIRSLKQRRFLRTAFSTYLAPQVVKQILNNPGKLTLGGEELEATIFFLDIKGFTSMSEKLTPKELLEVVNRILGDFSEIILEHEGMIDKFIGDCIMASWGMPLPQEDHANRAVKAACQMLELLPTIKEREIKNTGTEVSFRIGISTGSVIAGNVGGGQRFNYTALGNDVNLAARLESLNKYYGTNVLISESTAQRLNESGVYSRKLDKVRVVGQKKSVMIYEISGSKANTDLYHRYEKGLDLYFSFEFLDALSAFKQILNDYPDDEPSRIFAERCDVYKNTPPEENWDGVFNHTEK